jgi:hypothetical protein
MRPPLIKLVAELLDLSMWSSRSLQPTRMRYYTMGEARRLVRTKPLIARGFSCSSEECLGQLSRARS